MSSRCTIEIESKKFFIWRVSIEQRYWSNYENIFLNIIENVLKKVICSPKGCIITRSKFCNSAGFPGAATLSIIMFLEFWYQGKIKSCLLFLHSPSHWWGRSHIGEGECMMWEQFCSQSCLAADFPFLRFQCCLILVLKTLF